jgi:hypothetical protein
MESLKFLSVRSHKGGVREHITSDDHHLQLGHMGIWDERPQLYLRYGSGLGL